MAATRSESGGAPRGAGGYLGLAAATLCVVLSPGVARAQLRVAILSVELEGACNSTLCAPPVSGLDRSKKVSDAPFVGLRIHSGSRQLGSIRNAGP